MGAEQLIAFEAALAEISGLYLVAKDFRPLSARAESELLPATAEMGSRLRRFVRQGSADDSVVDAVARDIATLRDRWRAALEALRVGALYQSCLSAYAAADAHQLIGLVPRLFADCEHSANPPPLFYAVSPSSGRRRPGNSPFLTPKGCVARIVELRDDGVAAPVAGSAWWETEIAPLTLAADPTAFDTPLALRFDPDQLKAPVFRTSSGDVFRIFVPNLRAPFAVVLQDDVDDEWWQAFAGSYSNWRDAVADALRSLGIAALTWTPEGVEHE